MTGLDPDNEEIIEVFCLITDANLNVLDEEGWGAVIHQSKERMDRMVWDFIALSHADGANQMKRVNGVPTNMARLVLQEQSSNRKSPPTKRPTTYYNILRDLSQLKNEPCSLAILFMRIWASYEKDRTPKSLIISATEYSM